MATCKALPIVHLTDCNAKHRIQTYLVLALGYINCNHNAGQYKEGDCLSCITDTTAVLSDDDSEVIKSKYKKQLYLSAESLDILFINSIP